VTYDKASGKIVIFVSHTWWDREFKDETNHPDDPYDKGQLLPLRASDVSRLRAGGRCRRFHVGGVGATLCDTLDASGQTL